MTKRLDVICVGAANLDTIARVDHAPGDDERLTTDTFITAGGGPAATAAVTLARLGVRVGICAVVGDDAAGEAVRAQLVEGGVDTTWLRTDPRAQTAQAFVLAATRSGGRSIVTTVAAEPTPEEVPVGESTWLHVDQAGFSSARLALGRGGGARLSVDAGNPLPDQRLRGIDLYVPTLAVLQARYGGNGSTGDRITAAFAAARNDGAEAIVATAGSDGTYLMSDGEVEHVAAFFVDVESTLGAGDVFHGALLAGLVHGQTLSMAVLGANAAAALACTRLDGRSGIPNRSELAAFLADRTSGAEVAAR
jgi:sulfofructose kinase